MGPKGVPAVTDQLDTHRPNQRGILDLPNKLASQFGDDMMDDSQTAQKQTNHRWERHQKQNLPQQY